MAEVQELDRWDTIPPVRLKPPHRRIRKILLGSDMSLLTLGGGSMIEINGVRLYTKKELAKQAREARLQRERREGVKRTRWQRFWNWITGNPYRRYD